MRPGSSLHLDFYSGEPAIDSKAVTSGVSTVVIGHRDVDASTTRADIEERERMKRQ